MSEQAATVGDRIRATRKREGISQTDLAQKMGVIKQTLYKYETGIVTNIPSEKIEAAAKALGVTPGGPGSGKRFLCPPPCHQRPA